MENLLRLIPAAVVIVLVVWGAIKMTTKIDSRQYWKKNYDDQT